MIIVFGSINIDLVFQVDELPQPGETIMSGGYEIMAGGKGANQALAAARSGAKTALVAQIGNDGRGESITRSLRRNGVITSGVGITDLPTGSAVITVDKDGNKQIVVSPSANNHTTEDKVPDEILKPGNYLLLQMEVPVKQNEILIKRAHARGVTTMLNLAPALDVTKEMLSNLDYLVVNQMEARQLSKRINLNPDEDLDKMIQGLSQRFGLTCIVTMGEKGSIAATKDKKVIKMPALKLDQSVDKTGAGDAYCGTLAAGLHGGLSLPGAMKRAAIAGSLACTKKGAQDSMPYVADIEAHLNDIEAVVVK